MMTIRAGLKATAIAWRWLLRKGDGSQAPRLDRGPEAKAQGRCRPPCGAPVMGANPTDFSHLGADVALGTTLRLPSIALPQPRKGWEGLSSED